MLSSAFFRQFSYPMRFLKYIYSVEVVYRTTTEHLWLLMYNFACSDNILCFMSLSWTHWLDRYLLCIEAGDMYDTPSFQTRTSRPVFLYWTLHSDKDETRYQNRSVNLRSPIKNWYGKKHRLRFYWTNPTWPTAEMCNGSFRRRRHVKERSVFGNAGKNCLFVITDSTFISFIFDNSKNKPCL